ncbi:uncharacterized protein N7515_008305 [Penicillium bovifimosum]|uniref:Endoplasmic reticulum-Golgi intermediate compartment protein n=1 Tax=Penicillium bovifimosum TaxID=126998 RepID=A0A9W9KX93_9EURO|nr:uncharacterized protein N7515_008305 [Penicillium bovifimosum]KAJ5124480.1 hypothetical protein N7515_008305 [Penicillium bovifimosum]
MNSKLDDDAFGESSLAGLKTFDAFPKTKPSYTTPTRTGGQWTVLILLISSLFSYSELRTWLRGSENYHFTVEKGISHTLQLNLDMVIHMPCDHLRINIQDAAGDRILADEMLSHDDTNWSLWLAKRSSAHEYQTLDHEDDERLAEQEADVHVGHVLGETRGGPRKRFAKPPKMRWGDKVDACRIWGSLEGNKVQGDFHVTARGHGYRENAPHLDHGAFDFSHMITELSFGPHYPSLLNPLDRTIAETTDHYYKYQYFLSVVPTLYSRGKNALETYTRSLASTAARYTRNTVFTNQYAVTSQSGAIPESPMVVPGIFFKYNIEPIMLLVSEERAGFLSLLIRVINTISGVLVTGGWVYQIVTWVGGFWGRRRRVSEGYLTGKSSLD